MIEELIPIVAIVSVFGVIAFFVWLRYRKQSDMQQTVRLAIEKGQELNPELIEQLGKGKPSKQRDLRLAILWTAIGVALAVIGASAEPDMLPISSIPILVGVAYFLIWRFASDDDQR